MLAALLESRVTEAMTKGPADVKLAADRAFEALTFGYAFGCPSMVRIFPHGQISEWQGSVHKQFTGTELGDVAVAKRCAARIVMRCAQTFGVSRTNMENFLKRADEIALTMPRPHRRSNNGLCVAPRLLGFEGGGTYVQFQRSAHVVGGRFAGHVPC